MRWDIDLCEIHQLQILGKSFISVLGLLWCFVQVQNYTENWFCGWWTSCDVTADCLSCECLSFNPGRSVPMVHDGFYFTHWGGCYPGGCLAQEIRLSFWFNSLCGRMFETACDKELHCNRWLAWHKYASMKKQVTFRWQGYGFITLGNFFP